MSDEKKTLFESLATSRLSLGVFVVISAMVAVLAIRVEQRPQTDAREVVELRQAVASLASKLEEQKTLLTELKEKVASCPSAETWNTLSTNVEKILQRVPAPKPSAGKPPVNQAGTSTKSLGTKSKK
jgi:hypothetical protein